MKSAQDVRKQLLGMMDRYKHDIISAGNNYNRVRKAICSGYFRNACKKDPTEGYKTLTEGTPVFIHPSSALFNRPPEWCIYNEIVLTTKEYMHCVLAIEPKWLSEVAPAFYKVADSNKISKRKAQERIEPLFNKYEKPDEWRISRTKKVTRSSQVRPLSLVRAPFRAGALSLTSRSFSRRPSAEASAHWPCPFCSLRLYFMSRAFVLLTPRTVSSWPWAAVGRRGGVGSRQGQASKDCCFPSRRPAGRVLQVEDPQLG
jgi:hypothetical protein